MKMEMKRVSLAEVEAFYQSRCCEIEEGFAIESELRGLSFVVPKELPVRGGRMIDVTNPSQNEKRILFEMGINFGGKTGVLFGKFYVSSQGEKYFMVLPKEEAPHIMVSVMHGERYPVVNSPEATGITEDKLLYYKEFVGGDCYGDNTWVLAKMN